MTACGTTHVSSPKAKQASFNGVEVTAPTNWNIDRVSANQSCPPLNSDVVIVGDFAAGGDCASWTSTPSVEAVFVASEAPGLTAPTKLSSIGKLKGWQQENTNQQPPEWIAVLPNQHVQITFVGDLGSIRSQILNGVRAS